MNKWKIAAVFTCLSLTGSIFGGGDAPGTAYADTAYGYILPESDIRVYDMEELAVMPLQVICYAKNEIYARDGRMFQSAELQNYFSAQYWYTALYQPEQFTPDMLNVYEQQNLELLSGLEAQMGMYALDTEGYSYDPVYSWIAGDTSVSDAESAEMYAYADMAAEAYAETSEASEGQPATENDPYRVDPDSYIFYDSDRRYISESEMDALSAQELCYARNEIYARRGQLFDSRELTDYFDQKNWYWGYLSADMIGSDILNDYEQSNAALLQAVEEAKQAGGYVLDQPGFSFEGIGAYTDNRSYTDSKEEYVIWDSSIRYLTSGELEEYSLQEICYAKNEIYARRGYIFQSQELRTYFSQKPWYQGRISDYDFTFNLLNVYEQANVNLLKEREFSENPNGYMLY